MRRHRRPRGDGRAPRNAGDAGVERRAGGDGQRQDAPQRQLEPLRQVGRALLFAERAGGRGQADNVPARVGACDAAHGGRAQLPLLLPAPRRRQGWPAAHAPFARPRRKVHQALGARGAVAVQLLALPRGRAVLHGRWPRRPPDV
eukprot:6431117-Prymnesium_polylepis.1